MAELSVEEAQRLARQFLTGLAGDAEVGRLESALADDQTLALELLAQMQSALEDVAPEGLTQEQVKSVDARVEALVGPRIRRRGLFGIFKRLFKRRRKPVPARVARRPEPRETREAPAPVPATVPEAAGLADGDGMEEMAPIAPSTGSGQSSAPLPSEALAHLGGVEEAPASAPESASGPGFPWMALLATVVVIALLAFAGLEGWSAWSRRHARPKAAPVAASQPVAAKPPAAPAPTAAPKGPAPARRDVVPGTRSGADTLPAAIPPTTPQAAGELP
jgi:hypothetical protein